MACCTDLGKAATQGAFGAPIGAASASPSRPPGTRESLSVCASAASTGPSFGASFSEAPNFPWLAAPPSAVAAPN